MMKVDELPAHTPIPTTPAILAPRIGRQESKRDVLVREARADFAKLGFVGTHVVAIATRAGIRKSTFFHYFTDKDALFQEAVTAVLEQLADSVDGAAVGSFEEQLDQAIETLAQRVGAEPALPRLILRAYVESPPLPSPVERIAERLATILTRGRVEGRISVEDARKSADGLLALVCTWPGGDVGYAVRSLLGLASRA